jgi:hypothetical protein
LILSAGAVGRFASDKGKAIADDDDDEDDDKVEAADFAACSFSRAFTAA